MQSKINEDITKTILKHYPNGLIAIDLETTGLSPMVDQIIEIGAVRVNPDGTTEGYQQLINPQTEIPELTIAIHNITNEMVRYEPVISEVLGDFFEFAKDLPILAHNAKFDLGFLVFNAHKLGVQLKANPVLCSCQFARKALPELENHKLATLAHNFHIELGSHHRAYDDALTCLEVFANSIDKNTGKAKLHIAEQFNLKDFKSLKNEEVPDHILQFQHEIFAQQPMLMKYKGGSIKMEYRPIKPNSLLPLPNGPVLHALCLITSQFKSYSLKKIKDLQLATQDEIDEAIQQGHKFANNE